MSFAILGMGTSLPHTPIDQDDALNIARSLCHPTTEQETWLPSMYDGTGIQQRYLAFDSDLIADILNGTKLSASPFLPTGRPDDRGPSTGIRMEHYAAPAPPLAIEAAHRALTESSLPGPSITHLITVSCTGFMAPGIDLELIHALGLSSTVQRTHVGYMGCHGALNALRVAHAFAGSDAAARILICAVELCSLHYHYDWNPAKMIANAIFADGAAAVVGIAGDSPWRTAATGSCLVPDSANAMTWTIGNHGFEMTLSKRVPALIGDHLRPWMEIWLQNQGLRLADVNTWAIHPGGPRILSASVEALGLPNRAAAVSREIFANYGNMSSPTVLFILKRLRETKAPLPCVALGFGPGLMAEAVLFR